MRRRREARRLPALLELRYGEKGKHPEGLAVIGRRGRRLVVLVIYDSAGKGGRVAPAGTRASVHEVSL